MKIVKRLCALTAASFLVVALSSCGGGSSSPPPPVTYTIGGTMTNLASGGSMKLQDNGGDTLTVTANGPFTFATKLTSGSDSRSPSPPSLLLPS